MSRIAKNSPIGTWDEIDYAEAAVRFYLDKADGASAMDEYNSHITGLDPDEKIDLWFRFAANERSAMKGRREVRPPRRKNEA